MGVAPWELNMVGKLMLASLVIEYSIILAGDLLNLSALSIEIPVEFAGK